MDIIDSILADLNTNPWDNVWEQPNQTRTTPRDGTCESDFFPSEPE